MATASAVKSMSDVVFEYEGKDAAAVGAPDRRIVVSPYDVM